MLKVLEMNSWKPDRDSSDMSRRETLPGKTSSRRPLRRSMDAVSEELKIAGVRIEDAEDRVRFAVATPEGKEKKTCN